MNWRLELVWELVEVPLKDKACLVLEQCYKSMYGAQFNGEDSNF